MVAPNVLGKPDMVRRILSRLVVFPSSVVPKCIMLTMHMFDSNQSLSIWPGNPRTSLMSGDQKGPYKTQDPGPGGADWSGGARGGPDNVKSVSSS